MHNKYIDIIDINKRFVYYIFILNIVVIKGSLDEKLPIYEQDPKSKRLDSFEKRFLRD